MRRVMLPVNNSAEISCCSIGTKEIHSPSDASGAVSEVIHPPYGATPACPSREFQSEPIFVAPDVHIDQSALVTLGELRVISKGVTS